MALESHAHDTQFAEFVENKRWRFGGFLFVTIHVVGSNNALAAYPGRTPAEDADVARRTNAAFAWLDESFALATRDSLRGLVVAMHADPGFEADAGAYPAYVSLIDTLAQRTKALRARFFSFMGTVITTRSITPCCAATRSSRGLHDWRHSDHLTSAGCAS